MVTRRTFRSAPSVSSLDIDNPHPRSAICLCLDTSGSMSGDHINELNAGIRLFYDTIPNSKDSYFPSETTRAN
ncbi:MAG: hypothetical protein IJS39_16945 [Synergistaceae bacterium]|nr:hypothetical protein [Synergistaceae bacterium]